MLFALAAANTRGDVPFTQVVEGCDHVFNLAADMGGMGFIQSNHSVIMYNNTMIRWGPGTPPCHARHAMHACSATQLRCMQPKLWAALVPLLAFCGPVDVGHFSTPPPLAAAST